MSKSSQWQISAVQAEKAKTHAVALVRLLDEIGHAWTTEQINLPPSLGMAVLDLLSKVKT